MPRHCDFIVVQIYRKMQGINLLVLKLSLSFNV